MVTVQVGDVQVVTVQVGDVQVVTVQVGDVHVVTVQVGDVLEPYHFNVLFTYTYLKSMSN